MVAAVHKPGRKSGNGDAPGLEHALTYPECRHDTEALMNVILRRLTAQCRDNVSGEEFALPDRVLGIWHGTDSCYIDAEICDEGIITGAPGIGHGNGRCPNTKVRTNQQEAAVVDWQVGVLRHDRVCGIARCPNNKI